MQASAVAEEVIKTDYDAARIIFNRFQSAIAFKPTIMTVLSPDVSASIHITHGLAKVMHD